MGSILQVFYSVFSGALLSLAIPNELFLLGCPVLTIIALIPYYLAIKNAKTYGKAFWYGLIQAGTVHLCASFWLGKFEKYAYFTLGGSAFAEAGLGGLFAIFFFLPYSRDKHHELDSYSASVPFYKLPSFRIFYFALTYTAFEWLKSSGYLGYPWGTVSSAMFRWPVLMQISAITGTYGITFLISLLNGIITEAFFASKAVVSPHQKRIISKDLFYIAKTALILFLLVIAYGTVSYYKVRIPLKKLTTIFVQQNQDPWEQSTDSKTLVRSQQMIREKIKELKEEDKYPQLIVLSEGALQRKFPSAYTYYNHAPSEDPFIPFIKEIHTPLMTGAGVMKTSASNPDYTKFFNSALFFDEKGNYRGHYAKLHLVPFAESIPYMDHKIVADIIRKIVGISAGWSQGTQLTYFEIPCDYTSPDYEPIKKIINSTIPYSEAKAQDNKKPTVKIAAPICFDDSFTDVIRPLFLNGAELFVNMTDDSWSKTKSSEYQHFVIASYRSIEYRTTLLRSTNSGYSVVLDPAGRILADMPLFEEAACAFDVPIYKRTMTTYARFGNWLPYLCIAIFAIYSIYMFCTFTKTDYIDSERILSGKKGKKEHSKSHLQKFSKAEKHSKSEKSKKHKDSHKDSHKKSKHKENSDKDSKSKKEKKSKKHSKKSKK
ncbi:MAG: apolipoprotein N-acyltransferase [Treponema sp.]|nr:apolipoprotein N-acyltransferase [Treponema sp.]